MKVFFDTNVYIAEALLGTAASRMLRATRRARWRIHVSEYVLDEVVRVMVERLGSSRAFASATSARIRRRAILVRDIPSRHRVAGDPKDSPILAAAINAGVDLLVTNDRHLLALHPYEGLRIVSMDRYMSLLREQGDLPRSIESAATREQGMMIVARGMRV